MSRDNHHPGGERQPRPPRSSGARGREERIPESEIGPLGMGQAPVKDPLKSFNGMVIASSLTMEALALSFALPMLYKLYDGTLWTPFNYGFVIAAVVFLSLIHI